MTRSFFPSCRTLSKAAGPENAFYENRCIGCGDRRRRLRRLRENLGLRDTEVDIFHHSSDVQDSTTEYVLACKIYYTLHWPVTWRIGLAEGLSYAAKVPYVEREKVEDKGKTPSRLMNYLDTSVDVDLGKLLNTDSMEGLWLGWYIHHRSGIFSGSDAFKEISGGSNYNCVYLQYHW